MDAKDLRKAYKENEKQIDTLLNQYSARYTTKANKSIYNLMVIALRAELQNILYNLKYEKLDESINHVKTVSGKYLKIAGEGNQSIAGTLTKFIGEIEYLFINAVKIEYNYYVKREQAKQEQMAIREQMRQEAEERKALEAEHKKIEKEDAVKLEHRLHEILNEKRVNKVNLRKEFFRTSIDELEQIVHEIEPTAEFKRTMMAEEFRQSLSSEGLYTSDAKIDEFDEE